jgi:hypothetical protein
MWTACDNNTPDVENSTIASARNTLAGLSNPHGFHVVAMSPAGVSFNASCSSDQNIVTLVEKFFLGGRNSRQRKLVVDIGNTPAHNSKLTRNFFEHNPLKRLPHPSHSPDISPSDFYPFGK